MAVSSGLSLGEPYDLRSPLRLSNSANEQKLLKINYEDRQWRSTRASLLASGWRRALCPLLSLGYGHGLDLRNSGDN